MPSSVLDNPPEACATVQDTAAVRTMHPQLDTLGIAVANMTEVSSSPAVLVTNLHSKDFFAFTGITTLILSSEALPRADTPSLQ